MCLHWVDTTVAKWTNKRSTFSHMDKIIREGKKYLEKSEGTSKKGSSSKSSSSKNKGGGSVADKAKRAAKKFLK